MVVNVPGVPFDIRCYLGLPIHLGLGARCPFCVCECTAGLCDAHVLEFHTELVRCVFALGTRSRIAGLQSEFSWNPAGICAESEKQRTSENPRLHRKVLLADSRARVELWTPLPNFDTRWCVIEAVICRHRRVWRGWDPSSRYTGVDGSRKGRPAKTRFALGPQMR